MNESYDVQGSNHTGMKSITPLKPRQVHNMKRMEKVTGWVLAVMRIQDREGYHCRIGG